MNAKILGVLGVMALMVAVWFFYQEEVQIKPATPSAPDTSYEVTDITATQTNAQTGQTEYTLTAKSLVEKDGQDHMIDANMDWQLPTGEHYHIKAGDIVLNQQTGEITISDGFSLTKKAQNEGDDLIIKGERLQGNTKTRQLGSDTAVSITQANNAFDAQGFVADLTKGEYEFRQITVLFEPAVRTDTVLF